MRGSTRMLRWWPRVLRIYDESGRAVRVRVRYLVLLLVAVGFLGFSAVYLPVAMTSVPGFCDNCHLMVEPTELWKESTHSNVNCVECHVNPVLSARLSTRSFPIRRYTLSSSVEVICRKIYILLRMRLASSVTIKIARCNRGVT